MQWAIANSNLALVKYWGKAPGAETAASGSISVTLEGLSTVAGIGLRHPGESDLLEVAPGARPRLLAFLDRTRKCLGCHHPVHVRLGSTFPVAAGLASSASTFAALTLALAAAAGRDLSAAELAGLARSGSGSACRSVHGGWVEWVPGPSDEVVSLAGADHWALAVVIAVVSEKPKEVGSREGMARTVATSPYYDAWLAAGSHDLDPARQAIRARDLERLGSLAERNCLRMHAAAMGAEPPLLYWHPATVGCLEAVRDLRRSGIGAWASIDAGPQVKVLCEEQDAELTARALREVGGVVRVLRSRPGGPARLLDESPFDEEGRILQEAS